jgi:Disulphide bond corrector protein DsbC
MAGMNAGIRTAAGIGLGLACVLAQGQDVAPRRSMLKSNAVEYLFPEQVTVPAGKPNTIELHFRVAQGLHINSHKPKDEYLIPTTFSIPEGAGVRLEDATYPAGEDFTLPLDPSNKLSVYTRDFTIQARIVATKLHFQACDNNSCMPPKTIPVAIDVIGK